MAETGGLSRTDELFYVVEKDNLAAVRRILKSPNFAACWLSKEHHGGKTVMHRAAELDFAAVLNALIDAGGKTSG